MHRYKVIDKSGAASKIIKFFETKKEAESFAFENQGKLLASKFKADLVIEETDSYRMLKKKRLSSK